MVATEVFARLSISSDDEVAGDVYFLDGELNPPYATITLRRDQWVDLGSPSWLAVIIRATTRPHIVRGVPVGVCDVCGRVFEPAESVSGLCERPEWISADESGSAWSCGADGIHPDNRGNWCGAGCGRDYNTMTEVRFSPLGLFA